MSDPTGSFNNGQEGSVVVTRDEPLPSFGIVRVRPMSALESACGCRPSIVATPLPAKPNDAQAEGQTNTNTVFGANGPQTSFSDGASSSGSAFGRRARRTMSVFSHAPPQLLGGSTAKKTKATALVGSSGAESNEAKEDTDDDDEDNPFKLQERLLGLTKKDKNKEGNASGNSKERGPLWREEWVEPSLAAGAPDAVSGDIQYSATIQRSSPYTGAVEAFTFRLTHCHAPERVAVPVVSAPPGTQVVTGTKPNNNGESTSNGLQEQSSSPSLAASTSASAFFAPAPSAPASPAAPTVEGRSEAADTVPKNQQIAVLYAHPTQQQVFNSFGPAAIQGALRGQRQVILCYGATGTGKTHTLWGNSNEVGVVHLLLKDLVSRFASPLDASQHTASTTSSKTLSGGHQKTSKSLGGNSVSSEDKQQQGVLRGRGKLKEILVSMFDIDAQEKVTDLLKLRVLEDELAVINISSAAAHSASASVAATSLSAGAQHVSPRKANSAQIHAIVEQLSTIGVGSCPESLNATLEILRAALAIRRERQHVKHVYGLNQQVDAAFSLGGISEAPTLHQPLDLLEVIANGNPYPPSTVPSTTPQSRGDWCARSTFHSHTGTAFVADDDLPAVSADHRESTLTTVIRIEVLVSGGKTTVSAPILGGGGSGGSGVGVGGGSAAITTLSTVEADDLIGQIDIVECAGSEWLMSPEASSTDKQRNTKKSADGSNHSGAKTSSYFSSTSKSKNDDRDASEPTTASSKTTAGLMYGPSSVMAAAVRGAATEAVPTSIVASPLECQGLRAIVEESSLSPSPSSSAAADAACAPSGGKETRGDSGHRHEEDRRLNASYESLVAKDRDARKPSLFASLRYLHRSLLLLAATTGNAKQQAAAIAEALRGSLLTEYLSEVLNPLPSSNGTEKPEEDSSSPAIHKDSTKPSSSASKNSKPFNGRLFFIGTVSGADANAQFEHTVDTLRIADGVTRIGTFPTAKRDRKLEYAAALKAQIEKAKRQLAEIDDAAAAAAAAVNMPSSASRASGAKGKLSDVMQKTAKASFSPSADRIGGGGKYLGGSPKPQMSIVEELELDDDDDIEIDEVLLFGQGPSSSADARNANTNNSNREASVMAKVGILRELAKATERYQELTRNQEERSKWLFAARQRIHASMMEKIVEYKAVTNEIAIMQSALIAGWPHTSSSSSAALETHLQHNTHASQHKSPAYFVSSLANMVQRFSNQVLARDALATASTAPSIVTSLKGRRVGLHPSSLLFRLGGIHYQVQLSDRAATSLSAMLALYHAAYGNGSNGIGGSQISNNNTRRVGGVSSCSSSLKRHADPASSLSLFNDRGTGGSDYAGSVASTVYGGGANGVQIGSGGRRRNAQAMIDAGNAMANMTNNVNSNATIGKKQKTSITSASVFHRTQTPSALLQAAVPPLVLEVLETLVTGVRCGSLAQQVLLAAQKIQHQMATVASRRAGRESANAEASGDSAFGLVVTPPASPRTYSNVTARLAPNPVPLGRVALFSAALQPSGSVITNTPLLVCLNPTTTYHEDPTNVKTGDGPAADNQTNNEEGTLNAEGSLGGSGSAPFVLHTAGCFIGLGHAIREIGGGTESSSAGAADQQLAAAQIYPTQVQPTSVTVPVKQPVLLPPFFPLSSGGTSIGSFSTIPRGHKADMIANVLAGATDGVASSDSASLAELQQQLVADQQSQYYFSTNANGTSANTIHARISLPIEALNGGKKLSTNSSTNSTAISGPASSPSPLSAASAPASQTTLSPSVMVMMSGDTVVARLDVDYLRQEVRLWPIASRDNVAANIESANLKIKMANVYAKSSSSPTSGKGGKDRKNVSFGSVPTSGTSAGVVVPPDVEITVNGVPLKAITVQPNPKKLKASTGKAGQTPLSGPSTALDEANFMSKDGYLLRHRDRIVIGNVAFQLLLPVTWEAVKNGIEAPPLAPPDPDPFLMIAQAATVASVAAEKKRKQQLEKLLQQQQQLQRQAEGDRSLADLEKASAFSGHQALILDQLAKAATAFVTRAPKLPITSPPKISTTTVCTVNSKLGGAKKLTTVTEVLGPNEDPTSTKPTPQDSKGLEEDKNKAAGVGRRGSVDISPPIGSSSSLAISSLSPKSSQLTLPTDGIPPLPVATLLPKTLPIVDNAAKQPIHTIPLPSISLSTSRRLVPMLFQRGQNGKSYGAFQGANGRKDKDSETAGGGKELTPQIAAKLFEGKEGEMLLMPAAANFRARPLMTKSQAADPNALARQVKDHLKVCNDAVALLEASDTKAAFSNPGMLLPKATGETKTAIKLNASGGIETATITITTPVPPLPAVSFVGAGSKDPAVGQARELIKTIRRARGDDAADAFAAQQEQLATAIAAVASATGSNLTSPTALTGSGGGGLLSASAIVESLATLGVSLPTPYSMGTLTAISHVRQALLIESYERNLIMLLEACWFYENVTNAKAALQAIADISGGPETFSSTGATKGRSGTHSLSDTFSNAKNFIRFRNFATETVFRLSFIETQLIFEFPNEKAIASASAGIAADRLALFAFPGGDLSDARSLIRYQEIVHNKMIDAQNKRISLSSADPSKKKKPTAGIAGRGRDTSDDIEESTGLPKWVSMTGGAPPVLSQADAFELALLEARRFGDAAMLKRMLEQSELLRRANTIFAFVNPTAKRKKNADGTYAPEDEASSRAFTALHGGKTSTALTPENASPEEILALKQRLFAHLREQEGCAPDTLGDLLDSIETFMNGRAARQLFSDEELDVLRNASYEDRETLKIATQPPPSDAELYDLAKKSLASPNVDAAQIAEAMRFRIDYELRDFKKKMQAAREWMPNGPADPFARREWQRLCLEKHQNPTLQEVRENWEYDEEGGCVRGNCDPLIGPNGEYVTKENRQRAFGSNPHAPSGTVGELNPNHKSNFEGTDKENENDDNEDEDEANENVSKAAAKKLQRKKGGGSKYLAQPPFFEAYFFKLRVRRTLFHRGGGFHLVYGIIRGRFLYYFPECFPHHVALEGAYLFGAKVERTSMGVRQYCLRVTLTVQRKESKSNTDPGENELMLCLDTESEMNAWYDQLLKASLPEVGVTLKLYFGESQLSRFVQDSQLVEIVELDRKAEEALQKNRSLFSIGNFSLGPLSPLIGGIRGAVGANEGGAATNFSFNSGAAADPRSPPGSPRGKSQVNNGSLVPIADASDGVALNASVAGASTAFSSYFSNANLSTVLQRRGLVQRDPAKYRARAIMLALSESLGINPTQSAQISRKTTNLRVGELEGGNFSYGELRAIAILAADLSIAHYHFGGRKTYVVKGLRHFGSCSPSEKLLMPIISKPLTPAYEKAQRTYEVLSAISAFMIDAPKRMSEIGVPSTGIRVSSIHNARDLKKYFKTTIAPNHSPNQIQQAAASPPPLSSALKGSKKKESTKAAADAGPPTRLWLLDVMGGTIQLIDFKGSKAHVYEDRQLVRLERSSVDSKLLHMTFYNNGHHMFAEFFPTLESREEFCCLVNMMKPSARPYCPPLAAPPPNTYSMLYTVPGERVEAAPCDDPAAEPLVIEGEGQVRAAKDPIQKLSVWTGTLNVTGFPIHNPDSLEKWLPMSEEHDIYCVCLQEVSYRRGEQQLFSYLQRYFEDPNPAINSVIIAPKRYVELTAKEMGDRQWQKEMLEATKDSVTTRHNATVLPQQRRVLKTDAELRKLNYDEDVRNKPRYRLVAKVGLFDVQLVVFARVNHWLACSNIETTTHALSPPCYFGERGAVAVAFDLWGTSFCFTGVHLPGLRTPEHDWARRCLSHELLAGLSFANRTLNADISNQFDFFFALGDFNAPLRFANRRTIMSLHEAQAKSSLHEFVAENCSLQRDMSVDPQAILREAHEAAEASANGIRSLTTNAGANGNTGGVNLFTLLAGNKAKDLMFSDDGHLLNTGLVFSGFREPIIEFMPTFCIDVASGKYNIAKVIGPNYPDRILAKAPVYCPPVLNEEGFIEKLIELEDDANVEEEEEEETEDDKINKLITVSNGDEEEGGDAVAEGEGAEEKDDKTNEKNHEQPENGEDEEEEEEEEEGDGQEEDADLFLGGESSSLTKKQEDEKMSANGPGESEGKALLPLSPQTEDIGAALYPLHCVEYKSNTKLRISEHFPVTANFICNVPRPVGFLFMRDARRATITITDLRVTGVVFPFASQAISATSQLKRNKTLVTGNDSVSTHHLSIGGSRYGETADPPTSPRPTARDNFSSSSASYRPVDDAVPNSITAHITVNNHYLDPPTVVESIAYDITRFSSTLQDAPSAAVAPPCKFSASFPREVQLKMAIPTTPEHFMHSNISFVVLDQNDEDIVRGRRGAVRMSLMNFAGPVDAHVQKILRTEHTWELLQVPFRCPLEIAGNRMGCVSGSLMVSYDRVTEYTDDE